jgi:hypothetical protein
MTYSLPVDIAEHVSLVGPATHFPAIGLSPRPSAPLYSNTPGNLRALYNLGEVVDGKAAANKQAVTAFFGQCLSMAGLSSFFLNESRRSEVD